MRDLEIVTEAEIDIYTDKERQKESLFSYYI